MFELYGDGQLIGIYPVYESALTDALELLFGEVFEDVQIIPIQETALAS